VVKDPSVRRDDVYKSGTIRTAQGEPANSKSRPTPKGKPKAGKPITSGKLLRRGGPSGPPPQRASQPVAPRPVPEPAQSRPTPVQMPSQPRPMSQPVAAQPRPVVQPAVNGMTHSQNDSRTRAPPPPPPAPPVVRKNIYRALYDFTGQSNRELKVSKDQIVEVLEREELGERSIL